MSARGVEVQPIKQVPIVWMFGFHGTELNLRRERKRAQATLLSAQRGAACLRYKRFCVRFSTLNCGSVHFYEASC
jgi:hypothetical protein